MKYLTQRVSLILRFLDKRNARTSLLGHSEKNHKTHEKHVFSKYISLFRDLIYIRSFFYNKLYIESFQYRFNSNQAISCFNSSLMFFRAKVTTKRYFINNVLLI